MADVAPETGSVAHARSLYPNTSSLLKSIHPHKFAVEVTPPNATVVEYVEPAAPKLMVGDDDHAATPSSAFAFPASEAQRATASAFVVAYNAEAWSAKTVGPIRSAPTPWLATPADSYVVGTSPKSSDILAVKFH